MKKLLTMVVTLMFAATLFAGEVENTDRNTTLNSLKKQSDLTAKSGQVRTANQILFSKKKELGKLNYDGTQVPHGPKNNDVTIYNEDFEGAAGIWTYNFASSSTAAQADTTTFNAYQGEGGEFSWWMGSNDPSYDQPGYGHNWRRFLRHSNASYQLQPGLTSASIQFDAFYNLEEGWDGVHLQVSTDSGATWTNVACWSGTSGGWAENVDVDVSDFIGEWITFRFLLISDGSFDSQDGEIGSFNNPGGFFADNIEVRRNGVPELVSDGGDTKYNMYDGAEATVNDWFLTTKKAASGDTSVGHLNYQIGEYRAFSTFSVADLDQANTVAPLWLDFNVYSTIPYDADAPGGVYTYWRPIAYFYGNGTLAAGFYTLSSSVYVGEFGDGGDFVSYSDNFGYINLEAFRGGFIEFGILYRSFGGCQLDEGELYVDDFKVIQKNDPYEYNDDCDTASLIDMGFMSEFANIWDASDVDWFYFEGDEGQWVDIYVDNSDIDLEVSLWSAADNETCVDWLMAGRPCCPVYSYDDGDLYDRIIWRLPYTGGYFVLVEGFGDVGGYVMYLDELNANASIASITDREGDQGGKVILQFEAPELDNLEDVDFTRWGATTQGFQIERKKNIISSDYDIVAQLEAFGLAADGQDYRIDVPTVGDSMNTTFRVRTKTGVVDYQGVFTTVSAGASGMSYDNIAPVFDAEYTANAESGVGIDVGAEVDYGGGNDGISDIAFYNIYKGDVAGFTPSASNLIATVETHETSIRYNDASWDGNSTAYYVIEVADDGGNKVYSKEVNTTTGVEDEAVPTVYSLSQNYPNPFNPSTTIKFGIPQAADVTVKIYDILGQEVMTLVNRNLTAGFHTVNFDASNLISGMYIYRIQANGVDGSNFTDVKKMLLVK